MKIYSTIFIPFLKLLCEDFENITQLEQLATAFTENNITFEDAMSAALE